MTFMALPPDTSHNSINSHSNSSGSGHKTTLWMGDLAGWMDEHYIEQLWSQWCDKVKVKLIRDKLTGESAGYCFIDVGSTMLAQQILTLYHGKRIPNTNKHFKLNWASGRKQPLPQQQPLLTPTPPPASRRPSSLTSLHSIPLPLPSMMIPPSSSSSSSPTISSISSYSSSSISTHTAEQLQQQDMDLQSKTTVFVGGLSTPLREDELRHYFSPFGEIIHVKIPPGKGCGFVQYVTHQSAALAIQHMNGYMVGTSRIRLSWGKSQQRHQDYRHPHHYPQQQQRQQRQQQYPLPLITQQQQLDGMHMPATSHLPLSTLPTPLSHHPLFLTSASSTQHPSNLNWSLFPVL